MSDYSDLFSTGYDLGSGLGGSYYGGDYSTPQFDFGLSDLSTLLSTGYDLGSGLNPSSGLDLESLLGISMSPYDFGVPLDTSLGGGLSSKYGVLSALKDYQSPMGYDSSDTGVGIESPVLPNTSQYNFGKDPDAFQTYLSDLNKSYEALPTIDEEGLNPKWFSDPLKAYENSLLPSVDMVAPQLSSAYQQKYGVNAYGEPTKVAPSNIASALKALQGALKLGSSAAALYGLTQSPTPPIKARGTSAPVSWGAAPATRTPRKFYANGGLIEGEREESEEGACGGGLESVLIALANKAIEKGLIKGHSGGQDDDVTIGASPGEYVLDAETVSALGDGNTAAGAKKLDEMRYNLRQHKRSADSDSIAPKSHSIEVYISGGKLRG